ncbi:MAG: TM2 domain-containing protein [Candidatus Omnitrophica bacterium]|nr:TM2 domain-containing protein [Candidatus Omnitrophota bacterium]
MVNISLKSRLICLLLCFFLGWAGAHRFYVRKTGTGLLMLCTGGGLGIWWIVDFVFILCGSFRDKEDKRVTEWFERDAA